MTLVMTAHGKRALLLSFLGTLPGCVSSSAGGIDRPVGGEGEGENPIGGEGEGENPVGGEGEGENPVGGEGEGEGEEPLPAGPLLEIRSDPYDLAPGSEEYRCFWFSIDTHAGAGAIAFRPVGGEGVHHVVIFRTSQGVEASRRCDGLEGDWTILAGAGVGSGEVRFPEGVAMPVSDGDVFVLQLHMLNATGDRITIQGGYDVTLTEPGVEYTRAGMYTVSTTAISIPPGSEGYSLEHSCRGDLPDAAQLFNLFPHMHQLGRQFDIEVGGGSIYSSGWNFENQSVVALDPEVPLGQDDTLTIRCTWDNPTGRTVGFGLSTTDEMCGTAFYFYPSNVDEIRCVQ